MLKTIIRKLFYSKNSDISELLADAQSDLKSGRIKSAKKKYDILLKRHPHNTDVLLGLGTAFWELGELQNAAEMFVRAYTLDERLLAAYVNHAMILIENRDTTAAIDLLRIIKAAFPIGQSFNRCYGLFLFEEGLVKDALKYKLRDLLEAEDQPESASNYIFCTSYDANISEERLTGEHVFWDKCIRPKFEINQIPQKFNKKTRVAYVSPDIRRHSVAFFLMPLIAGHNIEKFEIILFSDAKKQDNITEKFKSIPGIQFHDTSNLSQTEFVELSLKCDLDFIVELAGHTANNRLHALSRRVARIQISGIGYPPTTGLSSIDYKIVDKIVANKQDSSKYYTERLLILPESFWCFDPIDATAIAPKPPCLTRGHITFGVVGNIAKITSEMINNWQRILASVPKSVLLFQSINFQDAGVRERYLSQLVAFGLPVDQVVLAPPVGGSEFYSTFNNIDIILDTYPFNGGTTSAFSLYMGTPIISFAGEALASRMGCSMLQVVGLSDLVANTHDEYVNLSVELAKNFSRLEMIKSEVPYRFRESALGNSRLFAAQFEAALEEIICTHQTSSISTDVHNLCAPELHNRTAYALRCGSLDYADNISKYAIRIYPDDPLIVAARGMALVAKGASEEAYAIMISLIDRVEVDDCSELIIAIRNSALYTKDKDKCVQAIAKTAAFSPRSSKSVFEFEVQKLLLNMFGGFEQKSEKQNDYQPRRKHLIIVACQDGEVSTKLEMALRSISSFQCDDDLKIVHIPFDRRLDSYNRIIPSYIDEDYIVTLLPSDACPLSKQYFRVVEVSLEEAGVVSFAGASIFDRVDWSTVSYRFKCGAWITYLGTANEDHALCTIGQSFDDDPVVLSGKLIAFEARNWGQVEMRRELQGGEVLMETEWTHRMSLDGRRLAIVPRMSVGIFGYNSAPSHLKTSASLWLADKYSFQILPPLEEWSDYSLFPIRSAEDGLTAIDKFYH